MTTLLKNLFVLLTGMLSALYLLNIGLGVVEFVPDNIPLLGNLDEAAATMLLTSCLAYFGLELPRLFAGRPARYVESRATSESGRPAGA